MTQRSPPLVGYSRHKWASTLMFHTNARGCSTGPIAIRILDMGPLLTQLFERSGGIGAARNDGGPAQKNSPAIRAVIGCWQKPLTRSVGGSADRREALHRGRWRW